VKSLDEMGKLPPYPRKSQRVHIVDGPFTDFAGTVIGTDELQRRVHVLIAFFRREMILILDVLQLEAAA
jgi:transcription antitermination factor NusG